jgi:MHS family proline/betaine transporter-like MFS transporter
MKKVIISCMVGNALEWYDFALYGFFVGLISRHFFPSKDPITSMLATYGAFAVAFILRPVGALVIGAIGDKIGRKPALILSLYFMALPTALIGLLPTYAMIGILAPILLTLLRFFQGFSMGGEFTGSMIFIAEHTQDKHRGLLCSFAPCSTFIGVFLGSSIASVTALILAPEALDLWGWRLPFLLSLLGAWLGIYMRRQLSETETFERMKKTVDKTEELPIKRLFTRYWRSILLTLMIDSGVAVSAFFLMSFITAYLIQFHGMPPRTAMLINTGNMVLCAVLILFFGWLSDKIQKQWVMTAGCLGFVVSAYPLFQAFGQGLVPSILAQTCLVVFFAAIFGPLPTLLMSLFPPSVRYSGMSFAHNLSMTLFGGTAPFLATYFIQHTGNLAIPGFYLALTGLLSAIGILMTLRRGANNPGSSPG